MGALTRLVGGCSSQGSAGANSPDASIDGTAAPACIPGTGATTTQTIGSAGGTLTLEAATLTIPPGALGQDTSLTVTSSTDCPDPAAGFVPETPLYRFEPEGIDFAVPVTLTMTYPGDPHGAVLEYTTDFGDLGYLASSTDGNQVSATVSHFSDAIVGNFIDRLFGNGLHVWFQGYPATVDPGGYVTLAVQADSGFDGSDCVINPGSLPVPLSYSPKDAYLHAFVVPPAFTSSTTFSLACPSSGVSLQTTVSVSNQPALTFTVSPMQVNAGANVTATWLPGMNTVFNYCALWVDGKAVDLPGSGLSPLSASLPVKGSGNDATDTFVLRCELRYESRSIERRARVKVVGSPCIALGTGFASCDPAAPADACCSPAHCDAARHLCCVVDNIGCSIDSECCNSRCAGVRSNGSKYCCAPAGTSCAGANVACCGAATCVNGTCADPPDGGTDASSDAAADAPGDAAGEAGSDAGADADAGPTCTTASDPQCGNGNTCCVGPRFSVLDPGTNAFGSGRIRDSSSGLTWTRVPAQANPTWNAVKTFCAGLGMRLATKSEALALSTATGTADEKCAFIPCNFSWQWDTWTSDEATPGASAYRVRSDGSSYAGQETAGNLGGAYCVQ